MTVHMSKEIMKEEAMLRELIRAIQEKRKGDGMSVSDKIILHIDGDMKKFEEELQDKVFAKKILFKKVPDGNEVKFEENTVRFSIEKA